jgi:hypothetical protein
MLEDPVNLVNEQKDPCSFPFEVINPPATSINDSIGMSELYAQLRINLADEKTRKREELLLELKSVEEAIARATHKVRN